MSSKNPVRNYAGEYLGKGGLSETQVSAVAAAVIAATPAVDATGTVFGDVTGGLLGPLLVGGIHGSEISPPAFAGDVNDYAPSGGDALVWLLDLAGHELTGIAAPDTPGEWHVLVALSAGMVGHEDAGSTDVNRILCPGGSDLALAIDTAVVVVYDGTTNRWRVVGPSAALTVQEEDGSPLVAADVLKVPNDSATDHGDGSVSLAWYLDSHGGRGKTNALGNITGAATVDLADGNYAYATLTGATVITPSGATAGKECSLVLELAGSFLATWAAAVSTGDTDPAMGTRIWILFSRDGGTSWIAFLAGARGASGAAGGDLAGTYPNPTVAKASQSFALTGVISPAQLTANTDDWNPTGLSSASIIRASTDASRNLTGIQGGASGRLLLLANIGTHDLVLKHDVTSTAANRIYCPNDADLTVQKDTTVLLEYDATSSRWRVVGGTAAGASPLTMKGDLYGRSASADVRVPVGTDGYPLVADSGSSAGVSWAAISVVAAYPFHDEVLCDSAGPILDSHGDVVMVTGVPN